MRAETVITFLIILQIVEQSVTYTLDRKFNHSECQAICAASEGKAEFDTETKLCKCSLTKDIDDMDVALINKNAKLIDKQLETIKPLNQPTIVIKREATETNSKTDVTEIPSTTEQAPDDTTLVSDGDVRDTSTLTTETLTKEEKEIDPNPEGIVGQANPHRRFHHQRLVAQRRHREPRPITQEQQRLIMQQIRDHLNRLGQTTDQRVRQIEIDAIRANLRQLSQSVLIQPPQQRSRMRNVVEENRKRQQRQRLMQHSHLVRAPAPRDIENSTSAKEIGHDNQENEVETALKEIFHRKMPSHFEIITQNPKLIDE
ncbi:hypothetical protein BDFB_005720 [Asbolus verrucosus]|uniref:Uncharacterized protein n=1 Tax=Asbolus verrucosus TaxID=1661398 RepID=A0A482VMI6_ASBVE|nr:hypothetical protein BDFB_005720 [Asbolus verrucosus]